MAMNFKKISSIISLTTIVSGLIIPISEVNAKIYLTPSQAQVALYQDSKMEKVNLFLTKDQMKLITKLTKTRVRNSKMNLWKTENGDWFIIDNVIGKHENIDIAVAISKKGKINGVEVLAYRETYGGQVMNPKWLAQFIGKDSSQILKLDDHIKNISGATLSCRNITDGVNRLLHSWDQVIKYL
jgi:Na+-translocating ferredoxin:NAD+ oxidoreductase RnfG subunit